MVFFLFFKKKFSLNIAEAAAIYAMGKLEEHNIRAGCKQIFNISI